MAEPYNRLLLKISGEQLAGKYDVGIDPDIANYLAKEIKNVYETGCQIVVVVGGGNMVRGAKVAGQGIKRVTADQMGMLSGLINSMFLTDIFESNDIDTRCLSNIYAEQVTESYSYRRAIKHLEAKRILIVAGGIGRPYFTHDTAAVSIALELDCQAVLKATKVDGVFDKDPELSSDAKKINSMTFEEALNNQAVQVLDKAAVGLAMEHKMPIIVFDPMTADNILKVSRGESVGTKIS
ncbi:MAG TPA: UMP kinase [Candidatus Saccharimonadales bacterium]|jgi:uridylate kinase